jgi:hypothetical protein
MSAEQRQADFAAGGADYLTVEGVLERVQDEYLLDPTPGAAGPVYQIRLEHIVGQWETGREVSYPSGERRPTRRVCIRRDCTALRLEYVRLDEALLAESAGFMGADCDVLLVPADEGPGAPYPRDVSPADSENPLGE